MLMPLPFFFLPLIVIRSQVVLFSTLQFIMRACNAILILRQPWTYCLENFPRAPVQCWRYQRNRWTRISTPTLNWGEGGIFPTFETKVVGYYQEENRNTNELLLRQLLIQFHLSRVKGRGVSTQTPWCFC